MAWAKFPTRWIHNGALSHFVWGEHKGNAIAALLLLMALAIQRNRMNMKVGSEENLSPDSDLAAATYDNLLALMPMSRSKVAGGLMLLIQESIIVRDTAIASLYRLPGIGTSGDWAKLPQSHIMNQGHMAAFDNFTLRNQAELDALKLYLLMIAARSTRTGFAHIGYEKMAEYTGVQSNRIKRAKSLLISNDLIYAETDQDADLVSGRPPMRYKVRGL